MYIYIVLNNCLSLLLYQLLLQFYCKGNCNEGSHKKKRKYHMSDIYTAWYLLFSSCQSLMTDWCYPKNCSCWRKNISCVWLRICRLSFIILWLIVWAYECKFEIFSLLQICLLLWSEHLTWNLLTFFASHMLHYCHGACM